MSLERSDFALFFKAVHNGYAPFAWQERLLDTLLETGAWPTRIAAPTGAGKTAAIDVHVFACALTAAADGPQVPRRLAMVVGRRVLVDDQHEHALALARLLARSLAESPAASPLGEIARRLAALRWPDPDNQVAPAKTVAAAGEAPPSPLIVGRLRGGALPSRDWRDHPTSCAVLCATPDMWGSRLLFRGYGSTRRAWPREAGLLAFDTAVVVDEAHLAQQLLTTARQVADLATVAETPLPAPPLQVVETTATPPDDTHAHRAVEVTDADLDQPALADRLCRPKPVRLRPVPHWPSASDRQRIAIVTHLADAVTAQLADAVRDGEAAHTVGCFVNTVDMAVAVTDRLRRADLRVVTICGQARPADLDQLRRAHPGILTTAGNRDIDVIVSTQSLEVGVDLDLAGIVTELAPGSALAQRFGRANRRGLRPAAPITVVVPADSLPDRARSGPYQADELRDALQWVNTLSRLESGAAPWTLRQHRPPAARRRRLLWQRPELADAWHWARTSDELAATPELDLWLTDNFDEDTTVGVVVRDAMPADPDDAVRLLRATPPRAREVFTVAYRGALVLLAELATTAAQLAMDSEPTPDEQARPAGPPQLVRVRDDETTPIVASRGGDDQLRFDIRPGDVIVIDSATAAFTASHSGTQDGFNPPVLLADGTDDAQQVTRWTAADVSHVLPEPTAGEVTIRLEPAAWPQRHRAAIAQIVADLAADADDNRERHRRDRLADLLRPLLATRNHDPRAPMLRATIELLGQPVKHSDVLTHRDADGQPLRVLVIDRRRAGSDERLRQTWSTTSTKPVTLDAHQEAVADRAALLAQQVGLPKTLVDTLRQAGAHHDDGKCDPRFQAGLAPADCGEILAKSVPDWTFLRSQRQAREAGLPERWRHEQRSVIDSWHALHDGATATPTWDPALAARLVGTSHGHGRHSFPHTAAELLPPGDDTHGRLAADLFDAGGWDDLIETTHCRFGPWGCAYLEALLRAADGQVSQEGR